MEFLLRIIPNSAQIVAPIPNVLKWNGKELCFEEAQEMAFLKIAVSSPSEKR